MSLEEKIAPFLELITEQDPSGPSLRYDPIYDAIREAMRSEESHLPQGVWQRKIKKADWKQVKKLCTEALQNKSKDLQISAWLIDAFIHTDELQEIHLGFQVFHDLMVKFWDTVHPTIREDGDVDFRLAPFIWLNEKLSNSLKHVKITQKTQVGATIYTFNHWIELTRNRDLYQVEDRPPEPETIDQIGSNKNPSLIDLEGNISKTPTEFYQAFFETLQTLLDTCGSIEAFLDQKLNQDAISLYNVKKTLQDIQGFARDILHKRGVLSEGNEMDEDENNLAQSNGILSPKKADTLTFTPVKGVPIVPGSNEHFSTEVGDMTEINSRDQAYEIIRQATDYLEQIEPHSPVPFMIKKAISLRNKNFMELMQEMKATGPGSINALWGDISSGHSDS